MFMHCRYIVTGGSSFLVGSCSDEDFDDDHVRCHILLFFKAISPGMATGNCLSKDEQG